MFSALKFRGIPLYKLARKGITINRQKRIVYINKITLDSFSKSKINITIECGRGTYIRSLAKDIAISLGTVGYASKLKRTRIGTINQNACIKINEFPKWLSGQILIN